MSSKLHSADVCLIAKVPECGCIVHIAVIPKYLSPSEGQKRYGNSIRREITGWVLDGLDVELADYYTISPRFQGCTHRNMNPYDVFPKTLPYQKLEYIDTLCKAVDVIMVLR